MSELYINSKLPLCIFNIDRKRLILTGSTKNYARIVCTLKVLIKLHSLTSFNIITRNDVNGTDEGRVIQVFLNGVAKLFKDFIFFLLMCVFYHTIMNQIGANIAKQALFFFVIDI